MRRGNENKKKDSLFFRLTVVQITAAVLIFLLLFLLIRKDGESAVRIRNEFLALMTRDWDVAGWFRTESQSVFSDRESEDDICIPAFGENNDAGSERTGTAVILTSAAPVKKDASSVCLTESFYEESAPVMPVIGPVTSDYGQRIHPITGEESFHSGRDISADEGDDILAVYDGIVIDVGVGELSGNYVKIDHGEGLVALYCHCSEVYASEGDAVRKGDIIAAVGATGAATGPHLHFEVRQDGELIDPSAVLDRAIRVG